jgi:hypothetical protein
MASIGDLTPIQKARNLGRMATMASPTGYIGAAASDNVLSDIGSEFDRGAKTSIASGVGLAAREALVSPVSRAMEATSNIVRPITSAVSQGVGSFLTGQPAAPAPAVPATPPTKVDQNPTQTLKGSIGAPAPAEAQPTVAAGVPAMQPAPVVPLRTNVTMAPEEPTPSLAPIPAADPTQAILAAQNDGTWSGMQNAHTMARRLDANRANAVAQSHALASMAQAQSSRIGADAQAQNATTAAVKTGTEMAREQAITQGVNFENQSKAEVANLRARYNAETNPDKKRALGDQLLTNQGKDPRENAFKIAQFEDAIDPQNPMAGTRKIPVMIDAQGNTRFITPPAANKGPSLEQWIAAAKADPRNKGVSDKDLAFPLQKTYGGAK